VTEPPKKLSDKKHPGPAWLFFYGRQRRGFPWLLVGLLTAVVVLALTFAVPGGADTWRTIAPLLIGFLILAAILATIAATLRPRRRR